MICLGAIVLGIAQCRNHGNLEYGDGISKRNDKKWKCTYCCRDFILKSVDRLPTGEVHNDPSGCGTNAEMK